jgi:NAD-dependent deacetylase
VEFDMSMDEAAFQLAAAALREAVEVGALTGAGISKESGLPTFREAQTGLWARYRPEDLATPEAFERDPVLVWRWYAWRRGLVANAEPNAAHGALVRLADRVPRFTLVTQNVDGLHRRAGSEEVLELHGDITRIRCSRCDRDPPPAPWPEDAPPRCACGALLRPDVVWFGEMLPARVLQRAVEASAWCDVFLVIGTSGLVYPAAGLTDVAQRAGATVIGIDPDRASAPRGAIHLAGSAAEVLPRLVDAARPG